MAKHKKKPDSDLDLEPELLEEELALVEEPEPALVEEEEEPALVEEEEEPALVEDEEPALVEDEEEPALVEEEEEPALVEEEEELALVEDEEPALADEDKIELTESEEPALVSEDAEEPDLLEDADAEEPGLVEDDEEAKEPALVDLDDDAELTAEEDDLDVPAAKKKGTGLDAKKKATGLDAKKKSTGLDAKKKGTGLGADADAADSVGALFNVDDDDDVAAQGKDKDKAAAVEPVAADFEAEPEPGLTVLTGALMVLNVLAAVAFSYILILDVSVRHKLQRAVALGDTWRVGLPVTDDEHTDKNTADIVTRQKTQLRPEDLKEVAKDLKTPASKVDYQPTQPSPPIRLPPSEMTADFLTQLWGTGSGTKVKSIKEEITNLTAKLPADIKAAAETAGKQEKADQNKQKLLFRLLMPLARTGAQVEALERKIQSAKGDGLTKLLQDAAQRRMLADILLPMEEFRYSDWVGAETKEPEKKADEKKDEEKKIVEDKKEDDKDPKRPDGKKFKWAERFGELNEKEEFVVSLEQMESLLQERFKESLAEETWDKLKRHSIEKRQYLAYFLLVINRLIKPDELADPPQKKADDKKADGEDKAEPPNFLYPDGLKRVQTLVGQAAYTQACDALARVVARDEQRILVAIDRDRGHYVYPSLVAARIRPGVLFDHLVQLLKSMDIAIPNEKDFKDQFMAREAELVKDNPQGTADPEKFMKEIIDEVMVKKANIVFGDDVQKSLFQRELYRLLDPREQGFVGRYRDVVRRIRDIAAVIEDRKLRLAEVTAQEKARAKHYGERVVYADDLLANVVAARAKTKALTDDLRLLQEQLYRAQLELADVEQQNLAMERRIRQLERTYRGKGGKQ